MLSRFIPLFIRKSPVDNRVKQAPAKFAFETSSFKNVTDKSVPSMTVTVFTVPLSGLSGSLYKMND